MSIFFVDFRYEKNARKNYVLNTSAVTPKLTVTWQPRREAPTEGWAVRYAVRMLCYYEIKQLLLGKGEILLFVDFLLTLALTWSRLKS